MSPVWTHTLPLLVPSLCLRFYQRLGVVGTSKPRTPILNSFPLIYLSLIRKNSGILGSLSFKGKDSTRSVTLSSLATTRVSR